VGLNVLFHLEILGHSGRSVLVLVWVGAFQVSFAETELVMQGSVEGIW
jgi:hypothetical protein